MIRRMTPDSWKSFAAAWQAHLRQATPAQIDAFIDALRPGEAERLVHAWPLWARRSQLPPPGDWRVWLLMAGRGFGKTRAGAEWVRQLVEGGMARSVALVGDTEEDVRQVMIEGPSGILAVSPTGSRPHWHRSLRRLDWPSGAVARCFSASDPGQLRGPRGHAGPKGARGPRGVQGATGPTGPAGSNATLLTDGVSVGRVVLARFSGITNVW